MQVEPEQPVLVAQIFNVTREILAWPAYVQPSSQSSQPFCTKLHGELNNDLGCNRLFAISQGFPGCIAITSAPRQSRTARGKQKEVLGKL